MDCRNYYHAPTHKQLLYHLLTAAHTQLPILHHYSFNSNAKKAKHPHEVRNSSPALQNSRDYMCNYCNYSKKRKSLLYQYRGFKPSRQSIQSFFNALLPMWRTHPTPLLYSRYNYPAESVVS